MDKVSEKIDFAIQTLLEDFERIPNKYLTEDDVRMHLCTILMNDFGNEEKTKDGDLSIPLHSETRWWGPDKRKERTDIVILDVADLSVTNNAIDTLYFSSRIPSKGYACSTPLAAIELKFRRVNGVGNSEFIKQVKSDINKLIGLESMMHDDYSKDLVCRVVALDKKEQINDMSIQIPSELLHYRFSNKSSNS
jgi:hypothetical protein